MENRKFLRKGSERMRSCENYIEKNREQFIEIASSIWEYAEVGYEEVKSSALIADTLEKNGFRVKRGIADAKTAFIAEHGDGMPIIAFTAEYDALPNVSQKKSDRPEPIVPGGNGHGCGHNLLGTASLAAALAVKHAIDSGEVHGTIRLYGTPAEELLTGKVYMAKQGVFQDVDALVAWHPEGVNAVFEMSTSANRSVKFHFTGVTAHAASDPHNGRSALDAVELMNIAANYLREHVPPGTKIHYATIAANLVPNIVPDHVSVWYYIRAADTMVLNDVYDRLVHCANGAAEMTGTSYTVEDLGGCASYMPNRTMNKALWEEMNRIPVPQFTAEEHEFARVVGDYSEPAGQQFRNSLKMAYGVDAREGYICEFLAPLSTIKENTTIGGSLDIGDVSLITPVAQFTAVCQGYSCGSHGWQCTTFSASSIGMKGMLYAGKVLANMACRLLSDHKLLNAAKAEFHEKMKNVTYRPSLPDDWTPKN